MENLTQTFREKTNLLLQLIEELQMKRRKLMSVGVCDRKNVFFVTFILSEGLFLSFVFFLNI